MIKRLLEEQINHKLFHGKAIIIYGARQVGKTTLAKSILNSYTGNGIYLNCELHNVVTNLSEINPEKVKTFFGNSQLVVLDEAQSIPNIGKVLKSLVDTYPEIQIIATGSSSFDLASKTSEPMTGRVFHYKLYPLSLLEIKNYTDWFNVESKLESLLRLGSYPEVFTANEPDAIQIINEITSSYLYKDLLVFEGIKKSKVLKDLLTLLALQLGNEVSYNELATKLGINRLTVQKYIDLLEQCFVVFKLNSFARNMRNEISKSVKIYFYDLGIRNSIIQNFNSTALRNDIGALWENFCIVERMKSLEYANRKVNQYFWRTYDQKEIDYIEEYGGEITGYEFKYSEKQKYKPASDFTEVYKAEIHKIDKTNFWKFVSGDLVS